MKRTLKNLMLGLAMVVGLLSGVESALAAYAQNTKGVLPPNIIDFRNFQVADQSTTTAAQDLGAARQFYLSCKVKIKALTGTATFRLESADNSAFSTNVRTIAISSQYSNETGTLLLDGYIDTPQEYVELVLSGTLTALNYDAECDYVVIK